MSASMIWRVTCDAPRCAAEMIVKKSRDEPPGWQLIDSAAHLESWTPPITKLRNGRIRVSKLTKFDVSAGSFRLHLCPEHVGTFSEHMPRTSAGALSRTRDRAVNIYCSCRTPIRWQYDIRLIQRKPEPNNCPERAWWQHLPAELQEYATRGFSEASA